jgi:hypothetical protein
VGSAKQASAYVSILPDFEMGDQGILHGLVQRIQHNAESVTISPREAELLARAANALEVHGRQEQWDVVGKWHGNPYANLLATLTYQQRVTETPQRTHADKVRAA